MAKIMKLAFASIVLLVAVFLALRDPRSRSPDKSGDGTSVPVIVPPSPTRMDGFYGSLVVEEENDDDDDDDAPLPQPPVYDRDLADDGDGAAPLAEPPVLFGAFAPENDYDDEEEDEDEDEGLHFDFYRKTCPRAEAIIKSNIQKMYKKQPDIVPALLRLFFHDCFIMGCDASVFLDDSNGNSSHKIERKAFPNQSLRGLDEINLIKKEVEKACPGIVSCADTLALAARDAVMLAGGPFYPILTGRRDSTRSYHAEANADLPKPNGNISETLRLFAARGFSAVETVSLLGGHNIGKIGCAFFAGRFQNFMGTGQPDQSLPSDFMEELRTKCANSTSVSLGDTFDTHYYQGVLKGRGVIFADQQLMADDTTARLVKEFAAADESYFKGEFAVAMTKMSTLDVLTGKEGEVRVNCSLPLRRSSM